MCQQRIAGSVAYGHHTFVGNAGELEQFDAIFGQDSIEHGFALRVEIAGPHDVDLVDNDEGGLVGEEGLDRLIQLALQEEQVASRSVRATKQTTQSKRKDGDIPGLRLSSHIALTDP